MVIIKMVENGMLFPRSLIGQCQNVMLQWKVYGGIAHLVERLHGMQEVWGSSPHVSTKSE